MGELYYDREGRRNIFLKRHNITAIGRISVDRRDTTFL